MPVVGGQGRGPGEAPCTAHLETAMTALTQATTRNFEIALDSIKRLENIALAHEQRLDEIQDH